MAEILHRVGIGHLRPGAVYFVALVLAVLLAPVPDGAAADFPALSGRVVDTADLVDAADEAALTATLAAFEEKSSDQIVVATIPDLGGEPLERYANDLFRHWGLGQADENNGVLLLVARDDRKIRIEVGYGLEGILTDLHARLIIENTLVPAFRQGEFSRGIVTAVDDIIIVLSGDGAELEARAQRNATGDDGVPWFVIGFIALWFTIFFGAIIFSMLAALFGKKLGPGRYKWLGVEVGGSSGRSRGRSSGSSWSSGSSGFSGGGGSSGGGGASGSW